MAFDLLKLNGIDYFDNKNKIITATTIEEVYYQQFP